MKAKSLALLMLALGCGLVASIGITQVMAKRNAEPAPTGETEMVCIALKDIPAAEHLSAENVKAEAWPKDKIPMGVLTKLEDIEGCRTKTKLYAGEPIIEKKLYSKGSSLQGDSIRIPPGYRVVPVKVDNQSGGPGLIMPGDRVDVLVHLVRSGNNSDIQETTTRTILQNIKVFAINDVVDIGESKDPKDKEKINAKTISLLVTPAQGAKLMLASEMGKVQLFMRSPDDESTSDAGVSTPGDLFGQGEKGDRKSERVYKPEEVADQQKKSSSFTDFLNGMKKHLASMPKAATTPVANNTWTVQILQPNGINEIVMESQTGPVAAKMPQGGWRVISQTMTSSTGGTANGGSAPTPPSPPATAAPAAAQPEPTTPANPVDPTAPTNPEPQTTPAPPDAKPSDASPVADSSMNSENNTNPIRGD